MARVRNLGWFLGVALIAAGSLGFGYAIPRLADGIQEVPYH